MTSDRLSRKDVGGSDDHPAALHDILFGTKRRHTSAANTLEELFAYARQHPGELSTASPGYGTQPHLLAEQLKAIAQVEMVHVPYKGPAQAITDLPAGDS